MTISSVEPIKTSRLRIRFVDGRSGVFDVRPFMDSEAFRPLRAWDEFAKVHNGGYYVEWECGADLSADTIEKNWDEDAIKRKQERRRPPKTVQRKRRQIVKQGTEKPGI